MSTTALLFGKALQTLVNKEWDYDTDAIVCALCTSSFTPDQDTMNYADDITNECTGGSYSRVTVSNKTVGYTSGTNVLKLSCDPVVFPNITQSNIRYAVFFADTGADSVSPILGYMDFGATQSVSGQNFNVTIPAGGLITLTAA